MKEIGEMQTGDDYYTSIEDLREQLERERDEADRKHDEMKDMELGLL